MGWRRYFSLTQTNFMDMYQRGVRWGSLYPIRIYNEFTAYGQGIQASASCTYGESDVIQVQMAMFGNKQRTTIKFIHTVNGSSTVDVYVYYMKDGTGIPDKDGYDLHGVSSTLTGTNVGREAEFTAILEGRTLHIESGGRRLGSYELVDTPNRMTIFIHAGSVSGTTTVAVTEVVAETYDAMEDIMAQMLSMMNIMMYVIIAVVIISLIVSVFRPKRKEKVAKEGD